MNQAGFVSQVLATETTSTNGYTHHSSERKHQFYLQLPIYGSTLRVVWKWDVKTKHFFLLRVPWSSSLILANNGNKLKQQSLLCVKDCLACLRTKQEVLPRLHAARLRTAFRIKPLPRMQTADICRMIFPWCFCEDSFSDKLLKVILGIQQNHTVTPWCWAQWKQILIWARQCHSFANFLSKFLLQSNKTKILLKAILSLCTEFKALL